MKRFIVVLLMALSLLGFSGTALATASANWQVDISVPSNTTKKTFNVQYTTLSTEADDQITVTLFQNGSQYSTPQTTTKPDGDSGVFAVTVPSDGTYNYFINATNTGDPEETKTTSTVTVTVSEPPAGATNTVFVNNGTNTGSTRTNGGQGGGTGANSPTATGAAGGTSTGQVGTQAATTTGTSNNSAGVLGAETKAVKSHKNTWWFIGGGLLALLVAAYFYYWLQRRRATNTP